MLGIFYFRRQNVLYLREFLMAYKIVWNELDASLEHVLLYAQGHLYHQNIRQNHIYAKQCTAATSETH